MLSQKEYALQVYNVLNNSNYTNSEDVEITTLENVVFINIKNDVSFVLDNIFNLYERQSTFNPNIPLRSLLYIADLYERMIKEKNLNIYGSKLIKIPTPKCVVFYNGEKEYPDKKILNLSDSFENKSTESDVQIRVTMLNINYSHNKELLDKCEVLRGYSLYNEKFREYNKLEEVNKIEAAHKALDYCIQHNVLADFFKKRRNEVVGMILEYTAEQAEKDMEKLEKEIAEKDQALAEKEQRIADLEQKVAFLMEEVSKLKS